MAPLTLENLQKATELVKKLQDHKLDLISSKEFTIRSKNKENDNNNNVHHVTAWRLADHRVSDANSIQLFPFMIRGLFTESLDPTVLAEKYGIHSDEPLYRIIGRGYEKFFNEEEIRIFGSHWEYNLDNSTPPYTLSMKEDGALILISALDTKNLFISTKHVPLTNNPHSPQDAFPNHAYQWLLKLLAQVGKTEADLATELYDRNITAVAEMCDDTFEEHVVSYADENRGLYLHGIQLNTPEPLSLSIPLIEEFAKKYNLHPVEHIHLDSWEAVQQLREECSKEGLYKGKFIEGFVLRARYQHDHDQEDPQQTTMLITNPAEIPPHFEQTFMMKIKFKNGYKMWDEWARLYHTERKVMKINKQNKNKKKPILEQKQEQEQTEDKAKSRLHYLIEKYPETKFYHHFVQQLLQEHDEKSFVQQFGKNGSHIKIRNMYYQWKVSEQGRQYISQN